jgi:cytochrome c-type biogenesis protein CcmH
MKYLLWLLFITPALAVLPSEKLSDPALEVKARAISQELRCMVCQNQSIDDSDAPLAKDLRLLVRERLLKGENEVQVKTYLQERYGDFILLKPPFNATTLLLWLSPMFALLAGLVFLFKWKKQDAPTPLTQEEQVQLETLLKAKS